MTIFISGVHGAGKSFLCNKYAEKNTHVIHESASSLIKKGKTSSNWSVDKKVINADENQIILAQEVNKILGSGNTLLLDGHTVLIDKEGNYIYLEENIFSSIKVSSIILIQASKETITKRIKSRDLIKSSLNIDDFLISEKNQSTRISAQLKIPLIILNEPSLSEFSEAVNFLISNGVK